MQTNYIFIDADGTQTSWLYLIVEKPTQVFYATQCAGLNNEIRHVEGFLIPLLGLTFDHQEYLVDDLGKFSNKLKHIFHQGQRCRNDSKLNQQQLDQLQCCIENITVWLSTSDQVEDQRQHLFLDLNRLDEITEAWVPVISPYGQAILIWKNCD